VGLMRCASVSVLALSGCSGAESVSNAEISTAINNWISSHPPCIDAALGDIRLLDGSRDPFHQYAAKVPTKNFVQIRYQESRLMLLVALFEAGLLTEGSTQVDFPSVPFNSSRHAVAVTAFNLTAAAGSAATYE
jgi:hypothetical protein